MRTQYSSYTLTEECLERAGEALIPWFEKGKEVLGLEEYPLRRLAGEVAELSSALIKGKREDYMGKYLRAYFSYFFPQGFLKTYFVLCEMKKILDLSWGKNLKINDLGTGPGASLLAAREVFSHLNPSLSGIEKNRQALELARKISGEKILPGDFSKMKIHGEIALLVSSLSETRFPLKTAAKLWENHRCLVVIEPGWAQGYSLVMNLAKRLGPPLLPCGGYRCKLEEDDWCHVALPFALPPLTLRLNSLLRHKLKYLKFTYGVFCKNAGLKTWGVRLRSPLIKEKGKTYFLACSGGKPIRIEQRGRPGGGFLRANCCDLVEFEGNEISPSVFRVEDIKIKTLKEGAG